VGVAVAGFGPHRLITAVGFGHAEIQSITGNLIGQAQSPLWTVFNGSVNIVYEGIDHLVPLEIPVVQGQLAPPGMHSIVGRQFLLRAPTIGENTTWTDFRFAYDASAIAILRCGVFIDPREIARMGGFLNDGVYTDVYGAVINISVAPADMLDDSGGVKDELLTGFVGTVEYFTRDQAAIDALAPGGGFIVINNSLHYNVVNTPDGGIEMPSSPTPEERAQIRAALEKLTTREDPAPEPEFEGVRPPCTSIFLGSN
jgi:hypothetical protein